MKNRNSGLLYRKIYFFYSPKTKALPQLYKDFFYIYSLKTEILFLPKLKFLKNFSYSPKADISKTFYIYPKQKSLKVVSYIYPEEYLCTVASQEISVTLYL